MSLAPGDGRLAAAWESEPIEFIQHLGDDDIFRKGGAVSTAA